MDPCDLRDGNTHLAPFCLLNPNPSNLADSPSNLTVMHALQNHDVEDISGPDRNASFGAFGEGWTSYDLSSPEPVT